MGATDNSLVSSYTGCAPWPGVSWAESDFTYELKREKSNFLLEPSIFEKIESTRLDAQK